MRLDEKGRKQWTYGTDYGDWQSTGHGQFCINGVIFPDREPHPVMYEAKFLMQPVALTGTTADPASLAVRVENRYSFLSLDHLDFTYALKSDAGVLASGTLKVPAGLEPGRSVEVGVDVLSLLKKSGTWREAWLEVQGALRAESPWADKGHVVAVGSMSIKASPPALPTLAQPPTSPGLVVSEGSGEGLLKTVVVRGAAEDWEVVFDKEAGVLADFRVRGQSLLVHGQGPMPAFLRAHTDNDRSGFPVSASFMAPQWLCDMLVPITPYKGCVGAIAKCHPPDTSNMARLSKVMGC